MMGIDPTEASCFGGSRPSYHFANIGVSEPTLTRASTICALPFDHEDDQLNNSNRVDSLSPEQPFRLDDTDSDGGA